MKHHLITAIIMALSFVPSYALAYDFSAVNEDGVTIYYNIISEGGKTCEVTFDGEKAYNKNNYYSGNVVIPNEAAGYLVTSIGDDAFSSCKELTSVEIPNSITSVGRRAFSECENLTKVTLPKSLVSIGEQAFFWCRKLTSMVIPDLVTTIGDYAFTACINLKEIDFGNSVQYLGVDIIEGADVEKITVGLGNPYFNSKYNCNAIIETKTNKLVLGCMNTKIPNYITEIGEWSFQDCRKLKSLSIPNSVKKIDEGAFSGCDSLASIEFGSSLKIIDEGAFGGCTALTELSFPSTLTYIGGGAFYGCRGLTELSFPSTLTYIGEYAFYAFSGCTALTELSFPGTLTYIGQYAFSYWKNLKTVTFPKSLKYIGEGAFLHCSSLEKVVSNITDVFETGASAFDLCGDATLYVPHGMIDTYRALSEWNVFDIEELPTIAMSCSCNTKGSITINGETAPSGVISEVDVIADENNTFTFTPKPGCRLDQVTLNGLDITANVEGNTLTCTIPSNSQMIVTFATEQGDMNNDGTIDISDVVAIVNKILL